MAKKDPVLALQVDVLSYGHRGGKEFLKRTDFESALQEGTTSLTVPKVPISGYAGKNPEEAFCEAVGFLVAYGPRAVHEQVRHWLEIVIPGKVKLATYERVAASCIIARRVAVRYLEAKGKAQGLSLVPKYKKALADLEKGNTKAMDAFALEVRELIESKPDWLSALSTQKMNAVRYLYRGVQEYQLYATSIETPILRERIIQDAAGWAKWVRTLELASAIGDEVLEIRRGPFVVVPIPGVTAAKTEGALEALDAAVAKIQPKCPKVLYGKVFLATHLKKGVAAWYDESHDTLALNVEAQKRFSDIFTIIHELGHRHDKKGFLSNQGRNEYWRLSTQKQYEKIEFDDKLRKQMADELVGYVKLKKEGKTVPAEMSEMLALWLKYVDDYRVLVKDFLSDKIDEKKLHDGIKGTKDVTSTTNKVVSEPLYVTPYGKKGGPKENYADGFAHFILGMDMPAPLAAILAGELK